MEAGIRAGSRQFYDRGKKIQEWDLNEWNWNGNLFVATPLNTGNSSSSGSEKTELAGKGKGESEKRRRIVAVEEEDGMGALSLNLGGEVVEAENGKRSKVPSCQVEGCVADLSVSKDYHRRHKVCEGHSKVGTAVVNGALQRFCQQCSRFHLLQEFDEGKRSCRRRLAGHNRRRRKTHPDATTNGNALIDDRASSYLLISLLRILSNLHSDNSDQSKDQDLLSHLLRNLATLAGSFDARNLSGLLQASQDSQKLITAAGTSAEAANGLVSNCVPAQVSAKPIPSASKTTRNASTQGPSLKPNDNSVSMAVAAVDMPLKRSSTEASLDSTVNRVIVRDFDLNYAYSDTQNCDETNETTATPAYVQTGSPISPSWFQDSHRSSPPMMSVNSDSSSGQMLSGSSGDAQSRTDRIVFKLFGKDPNDFPLALRSQILDWLSRSPTDVESYIRPGCIILTIYLRLAESAWEELCHDLSSSLNKLLCNSGDDFWRTGWLYASIQHHIAFIYNGQVLLNTPRLLESPYHCKILSVAPVAAATSARVNFTVKVLNPAKSTTRLLCAFEGKYLVQETTQALVQSSREQEGSQCLSFSCALPNVMGRGFIEVEDHGLRSCFFPFIVAENDVCCEIRTLENALDVVSYGDRFQDRPDDMLTKKQALEFLNEMGWLLRRSHLRFTSKQIDSCPDVFSLSRFRWLMVFALDQEWCAVVKKLLDLLFHGTVDLGGRSADEVALSEGILHSAVRKNCKSMVELLLRYRPDTAAKELGRDYFLFKPDILGPADITPLHLAATMSTTECVLDALTDDPGQLGIKAWKNARDSTGFTPEDYARSGGHESYMQLVQKKINKNADKSHVLVDIPGSLSALDSTYRKGLEIDKSKLKLPQRRDCNLCSQQLARRTTMASSLLYRPAMLSMVGIAAVCVCVGLLFKGPPEVMFVVSPFRWETLAYGSI